MYKATSTSTIIRIADGAHIPADPGNADFMAYTAWVNAGNTAEPADVPPAPSKAKRIAALFAPYNISRVTAQMVLGMGELEAKLRAATQTEPEPISYEDALADTATRNRTYQVCRALEDAALLIDKEPTP